MRVVLAYEQSEQVETARSVLLGMGLECGAADSVPYGELPVRLAQGGADLVAVRVGGDGAAAQAAIRQALGQTQVPVLAVGPTRDAQQILQTTRSGAREYLDEDNLQVDLEAALEKLRQAGAVKIDHGLAVAVLSATPGAGVSTVATNLAFSWAEKLPERVCLVELGRQSADLALSLDLTPRHTMADVADNWERLDTAMLRHSLVAHSGGVQVLAYKPETLTVAALDPRAVRKALIVLRTMVAVTVLDLGHAFGPEHYEALRLADRIVVVVRLDVPGVRHTRQLLNACDEHNVPRERLQLVANRHGQKGQLPWKKAEEAIGAKFVEFIPEDCGNLNNALNQGQPLVRLAPRATISRSFAKLASLLHAQPAR